MCQPMAHRHAYYKYITITVILATSLEFPRFFEMKLEDGQSKEGKLQFTSCSQRCSYIGILLFLISGVITQYWTTDLMENPIYVQFNSYWIDIFATGLVPLLSLCYMNLKIFLKIKVWLFSILEKIPLK